MRLRHPPFVASTLLLCLGATACATSIDVPAGIIGEFDAGPTQQQVEPSSGGFGPAGSGGFAGVDESSGGVAGVDESSGGVGDTGNGGFGAVGVETGGTPSSSSGGSSSSNGSGGKNTGGSTDLINVPVSNKGSGPPGVNTSCGLSSCAVCNIALGPACCTTAGKCGCPLFWIPGTCG
jgi:hypothetical protein